VVLCNSWYAQCSLALHSKKFNETETYEICVILEGEMKVCNPPAIPENEDISFLLEARRFGSLEHLPFVKDLEGVHPVCVLQLDDADLAERAAPDHLQDLEVVLAQPKGLNPISHRFNCKKKDMEMSLDSP
jgi:hypothetical protein